MRIVVIGAGPGGLMCASQCAETNEVIVLDQNEKAGKKLYITGKGRCNVTNNVSPTEFLENVVNNKKFLYSSINVFTPQDTIDFFEKQSIHLKTERGNRVFPFSDKASDITKGLEQACKNNGVKFLFGEKVLDINRDERQFFIKTSKRVINCDALVVCCGGVSYSATGSDGSLYQIIEKLGHTIVKTKPALCPILLKNKWVKDVEGLSLKNVELKAISNNKVIKNFFGEMLFTRKGISGPIVLSLSSYINTLNTLDLVLDFKPALTEEKLLSRIERDCENLKNNELNTLLKQLLPKNLVQIFLQYLNLDSHKIVKTLNLKEKQQMSNLLKKFPLEYDRIDNIDFAIVTSGGVSTKEINPKTMQSKIIENLYFAGEVIDIDALTGGFNIQIALSTGYSAGFDLKYKEI